jgi:acyl carrier protein
MSDIENKIKKIMSSLFSISTNEITNKTSFNSVKKWDSIKHLEFIIALEKEFQIKFDADEIPTLINFQIIHSTVLAYLN